MKKIIYTVILNFAIMLHSSGQAPQVIPYHAVARNNTGNTIANQAVSLRFTIHNATAGGTIVYQETQIKTTSPLGLFTANIGEGTIVSGTFAAIDWGVGSKFMQVEMDIAGGTAYTDMGTQQMLSVPYALYSEKANVPGVVGPQGPAGTNGINGSAWRNGTGAPSNTLGVNGDYYLNATTDDVYLKTSGIYTIVANIKGSTGTTGATGNNGVNGSTWRSGSVVPSNTLGVNSDYYLHTITSDVYLRAAGVYAVVTNIKGATGSSGANGVNGSTWYSGTGIPLNALGINGDYYLNVTTDDVFLKTSGTYSIVTNIKGLTGATGPAPTGIGIVSVAGGSLQTPGQLSGDVFTTGASLAVSITPNAVNSSKIADSSISNLDISASANISRSKIAPGPPSQLVVNDGSGNLSATPTVSVSNGGTGTNLTFTEGSVLFAGANGIYRENNANFFYDHSNTRLGIGTTTPEYKLDVSGIGQFNGGTTIGNVSEGFFGNSNNFAMRMRNNSNSNLYFQTYDGASTKMAITNNGNVGIGTTSPLSKLDVDGGIAIGSSYSGSVAAPSDGAIIKGKVAIGTSTPGNNKLTLIGNEEIDGSIYLNKTTSGIRTVEILNTETTSDGATIRLYNASGTKTIEMDADYGDGDGRVITNELQITGGSDLAEHFNIDSDDELEVLPGMLVSIDPKKVGSLCVTNQVNDKKVVGVISGANGIKPGMMMGQSNTLAFGKYPIALVGRVYVLANSLGGQIEPGDFLTTSSQKGYAQKVNDLTVEAGSIIGKAMSKLDPSTGFVLVLISLQ